MPRSVFWLILLLATVVVCQAQPLAITTTQLPFAQLNLPYNAALNATGGTPPYNWTCGGGLPPGLSCSPAGVISGTPTGPGDNFLVQVTDANFPLSAPAQTVLVIGLCGGALNPPSQGHTFEDTGGPDVLSVTSTCGALTPGSSVPWISITGNNGVDTANILVAPNATSATRTGNVTFTYNSVSPVLVLSYTVTQYAKLQFTNPSPLPLGVIGIPYSVVLQATGGSGIGRSFGITSGSLPAGLAFSAQTISGTPTLPVTSSFTVQVTDHDGFSGSPFSGNRNYSLTIAPPLVITSTVLPGAIVGLPYSATLAAGGGIPPYNWSLTSGTLPQGLVLNSATGVISGTPALNAQGSYAFTLRASDSVGLVSNVALQILVDPMPLVIRNPTLAPATEGVVYGATFSASGGTPPYAWSAAGLPAWLTLTASGQLSGTPPLGAAGSYNITINVQDSASHFTGGSFTLQVIPGPPMITTSPPLPHAKEGSQFSMAFQASGGSGPYTWSATGLPAFLNLSPAGVLSGTPPAGSAGSYGFSLAVVDAVRNTASGTYNLTVDPVLSISTSSSLEATEGEAFSANFNATGGTTPYAFSASGLPNWLSMSPAGVLSGTAPRGSAGGLSFSVTVGDSAGHIGGTAFVLVVLAPNGGLTITTPSALPIAAVGNYYQAALSATGGKPGYHWSGAGIPDGLTLSSGGLLSGTPGAAGDFTITAQLTDSSGAVAFQAMDLQVTAAKLRVVTPSPLAVGEVSVDYSMMFQSDSGSRPLVWSASGPLPAGLRFDSTGLLSGTPTAPGDFVFSVRVTDSTGASAGSNYEVLVQPFGGDLMVSAGSLAFTAVPGGAAPPEQTVAVISSTHDSIAFSTSADSPWLTVASSGATPGRVDISVDQTGLVAGDYSGMITVTAQNRGPRIINVRLSIKEAPAILQASPAALQFFSDGSAASTSQIIHVQNSGRGSLNFTVSADTSWLSVGPGSGTVDANTGAFLAATANFEDLAPGAYAGNIEIDSVSGTARIPVSLMVSQRPKMILSAPGILLQARQGNGVSGPSPMSFTVASSNGSTIHWTAQEVGGEDWLSLSSAQGTATNSSPGIVSFAATSATLQKGAYYALIRISSAEVFNSPQDFLVVLNVSDAASSPVPDPVPSGLVFTSSGNQTATVYTSSDQPAPYQVAVATQDGGGWLSATPLSGTISTAKSAQIALAVNAANLKRGIYRGSVNVSISNLAVRTINVSFIVVGSGSEAGMEASREDAPRAACTPSRLVLTGTSIAGNFSTPAAWPRTMAIQLSDDCGSPISSGKVVAEFSNGDPPLSLNLSDTKSATYSATWTPVHATAQLTATARATAAGFETASTQIVGAVTENVAPVLAKNGTLHNLNPQPGAPLAPGTIVQIFGSGLAASTGSTSIPLPLVLNGTSVLIAGELAPLYFVSSNQINAQIPADLSPGQEYQVVVVANNSLTTPDTIRIAPATPGIARLANGQVISQHADFSLVTEDSPAKPGDYLVAYLAGMGLTDTPVATGAQSPSSPLASVNVAASVRVDGEAASVLFAGLTPGFVGLYQINFQVPPDAQSGDRKLEIFQAGVAANTTILPVAQ